MKSARANPRNAHSRNNDHKKGPAHRNATTSQRKVSDARIPKIGGNKAHSGKHSFYLFDRFLFM